MEGSGKFTSQDVVEYLGVLCGLVGYDCVALSEEVVAYALVALLFGLGESGWVGHDHVGRVLLPSMW